MTATTLPRGGSWLRGAAYLIVVVAGLRAAADLVLPVLIAAILALVCAHPVDRLRRWGVPNGLALGLVVAGVLLAVVLLSGIFGRSVALFAGSLGGYEERLHERVAGVVEWLRGHGVRVPQEQVAKVFDTGSLLKLIVATMEGLLGALSDLVVILLIMVFMLAEATGLPGKLRRMLGSDDADLTRYTEAADQVYRYLALKTGVSLANGVLLGALNAAIGVPFPVLWGLVAFFFNFIPNIGSVIAAIPPVLLAWLEKGPASAVGVVAGYVAVGTLVGNVLEPRLMGRSLGLSPLVVLLSMIVWGWILGPVGMLLSVPLTMVMKIAMEHTEDLKPASVLLGP